MFNHCIRCIACIENVSRILKANSITYRNFSIPKKCMQVGPQNMLKSTPSAHALQCASRTFHTSRPRPLHPVVLLILRPVARVTAVLVGRGLRLWWQKLPAARKLAVERHFTRNRMRYGGVTVALSGATAMLYAHNCIKCPHTGKMRFLLFRPDQLAEMDQLLFQEELQGAGERLMGSDSPDVKSVLKISNRLINAYSSLGGKHWQLAVIDSPEVNGYSLSSGQIVLYTGMLRCCANEHQLAAVIAHEMAHVLLQHQNITLSHRYWVDFVILLPLIFLTWSFIPSDVISLMMSWIFGRTTTLALVLPYSRDLEIEADVYGLCIMATACYDVREASALWGRLHAIEQQENMVRTEHGSKASDSGSVLGSLSWLSTHPTHEVRYKMLDSVMESALEWRDNQKCPKLNCVDPRQFLYSVSDVLQENQPKNIS